MSDTDILASEENRRLTDATTGGECAWCGALAGTNIDCAICLLDTHFESEIAYCLSSLLSWAKIQHGTTEYETQAERDMTTDLLERCQKALGETK